MSADYIPPGQVDGRIQPTTSQIIDPAAPKATICVEGDSITDPRTYQSDTHDPTSPYTGPMPWLADDFHTAGINATIWNFSLGGRSLVQGAVVQPFILRVIVCDYLVIELGQNDDPNGFQARLAALSDDVPNYWPNVKVILSFMWPAVAPAPQWQIDAAGPKNTAVFLDLYPRYVSSGGHDFTFRPGVAGYVDAGQIHAATDTTGIHLKPAAYPRYGAVLYNAMAPSLGRPTIPLPPGA